MDAAEIVVTGHDTTGSDRFRSYLSAKLAELDHLDQSVTRYDVDLHHQPNPRRSGASRRVVITSHGAGAAMRAEASAADLHTALEVAVDTLEGRMRRKHDRRVHRRPRSRRPTLGSDGA
jgi:ribosomal subunit interface protein